MGRDAKLAFQKAAGIFIMYLTYCATDFCKQQRRSTISANDVFEALTELEFDEYIEPLKECLAHFRKSQQGKKEEKKRRDAARDEERRQLNVSMNLANGSAQQEQPAAVAAVAVAAVAAVAAVVQADVSSSSSSSSSSSTSGQ